MMRALSVCLRLLAALFQIFPLRKRVAFLSRQSKVPPSDFRLLSASLQESDPTLEVRICATDSELSGKLQFALHMFEQLWLASTSRVVVLDGYNPTVCIPRKRQGVFVVQLWHSAGAIKKFGFQCLNTPAGRSTEQAEVARMHRNYDLIVAAGPGAIEAYSEAFGYPPSSVIATGLPHIDRLVKRMVEREGSADIRTTNTWLDNGNINVVYAPTLRRDADASWLTHAVDELAEMLADAPVNLIVSKHPLTTIDERLLVQRKDVHVLASYSTTSLLSVSDVLVSDYSAISLEAGLAGIPVVFYVPDIEQYRMSPGLNIDPVAHPQLFGSSSAADIAAILMNRSEFNVVAKCYQAFVREYYAGIDLTGSTRRITELIKRHLA